MKTPKLLAVGLIAGGLVTGGSTVAHATTASPYVTVAWSFDAYPDLTKPQPYVTSTPGADLHAFDALAASPEWCGKPLQIDVYKLADEHGRSWETLKESGALQYAHDGGFLAYDAGVGTPYRVIYPEEFQCTTPTPEPTPTAPATPEPSSTPTSSPEPSETPTPTDTPSPTPATPSPTPSATVTPVPPVTPQPSDTPTPSAPVTAPTPTDGTTPPSGPTAKPSVAPSTPTSKQTHGSTPASTNSAGPAAADTSRAELAYTGTNPWPGIGAAAALVLAGLVLLIVRRVRRG